MSPTVAYLVAMLVPLVLKTTLYVALFRWRKRKVTFTTSVILAGSPLLLMLIPVPLPTVVVAIAGLGIALYVLAQYTKVPLIPEGIAIVCGVELLSRIVLANVM